MNYIPLAAGVLLAVSPAFAAQKTTFVHLFEWRWSDIASECENYLGPQGYAAIQVSPPSEHIQGSAWWTRYQPVSYQLQSRSGDRAAFINMVQRCKAVGVDIYVDAVINHMASGGGVGIAGSNYGNKAYPMYSAQDFNSTCTINGSDYGNNRWRVQNCELVGLPDLNTSAPYVQNTLAAYLNDLLALGVKGFRIDAAKHMAVADIAAIKSRLTSSPLIYQEVIDQGGEVIQANEYTGVGLVTEFKYSVQLGNVFKGGRLASLANFGEGWGFLPSAQAVVFVDNHDNQRGHGGAGNVVTYKDGRLYDLANVFMLAYPYGYPQVMSSYAFSNGDQGPPASPVYQNGNLNCFGNDWKCEHRWGYIAGAVQFRNHTAAEWRTTHWWDNGNNQIAFGRAGLGFVAINREGFALNASLLSGMAPGQYCNVLKGQLNSAKTACSGEVITVAANGRIQANVSASDAFAIHHQAKIGSSQPPQPGNFQRTVVLIQAQTQSGQDMFVRGGLDHAMAQQRLGLNCTATNMQCAMPIRHRNLKNTTTAPWKSNDNFLDWYGREASQNAAAEGTALDWTTNSWPAGWGALRTVAADGYGVEALNRFGAHYWMLDVDMDCSKTINGWFELKAFVKNGQGWEGNIAQPGTPYPSANHMAQCGKLNVFSFGQNAALIENLP
ncbi:MAG: alpha-amylase [Rheinheimera sp.]